MSPRFLGPVSAVLLATVAGPTARADTVGLTDLGTDHVRQDWGKPGVDRSVDGHPLSVGGQAFDHGLGTHAGSTLYLDLHGSAQRFTARVGVDDEVRDHPDVGRHPPAFAAVGDGKPLFRSGPMRVADAAKPVDVDLHGVKTLVLSVAPAAAEITDCHADWADATVTFDGAHPVAEDAPAEAAEILTPPPAAGPRINSAAAFGVRPGHPVLYTVVATGEKPVRFAADGLPAGATLDPGTGRITGSVPAAGTYAVSLHATNAKGSAQKKLGFVVGDRIALTPPMGWNSWNCFAQDVSQAKVQAAADAMVSSGLADHGWTYVNVDDCWEVPADRPAAQRRAPDGQVLTNAKFPDMGAMADYIHAKGLRAGLYSSPGTSTCGGYTASFEYEVEDAHQYAAWGFDYLKYDWCSYDDTIAHAVRRTFDGKTDLTIDRRPYAIMGRALAGQDRDVLYSFCQYGMGDVWKWGDSLGGNCWRTTGDINDSWASMAGIGFSQSDHAPYAGPGHWNDPDMLVVGRVGWGPGLHPTQLTPNEQYTHISLWSLLSAPLLIGCDMTQMDPFTFSLLSNDDVIAVNQDPLGKQATRVWADGDAEAWAKPLADGSTAVGLFNRGEVAAPVTVMWADLHLAGGQHARDLWRQADVATDADGRSQPVGRHGCVLLKLTPATRR